MMVVFSAFSLHSFASNKRMRGPSSLVSFLHFGKQEADSLMAICHQQMPPGILVITMLLWLLEQGHWTELLDCLLPWDNNFPKLR
jgi:hypothetical protein